MSYQNRLTPPIQDPYHTELMAHELLLAIEEETLNVLWLRPQACAILLHKALNGSSLSMIESWVIQCLHRSIKKNTHSTSSFIENWIIPFFFETINE
jgi:hypothetical protein